MEVFTTAVFRWRCVSGVAAPARGKGCVRWAAENHLRLPARLLSNTRFLMQRLSNHGKEAPHQGEKRKVSLLNSLALNFTCLFLYVGLFVWWVCVEGQRSDCYQGN